MLKGTDERNSALLNMIPTQERLPEDMLRLERTSFSPTGHPIKIVCVGVAGVGLTRGSDNDFLVALINTYIESGCPEDGIITTSAYALLKLAGRKTGGQYYLALSQSMERMLYTTFNVTDGWFDMRKGRYTTVSFRIIDNLTRTHDVPEEGRITLDRRSMLKIRLNDQLTKSIKAGYIKSLNMELYQNLPSIGARALYRYLDVVLHESAHKSDRKPFVLSFELLVLAGNCGLIGKRTDHLRKSLESMYTPLIEHGYLKRVEFVGRGVKTIVHFTFNNVKIKTDEELKEKFPLAIKKHVELLMSYGVNVEVAWRASHTVGDAIYVAIERVEDRKKKGHKFDSLGAYLAKILLGDPSIVTVAEQRKAANTIDQMPTNSLKSDRESLLKFEEEYQQDFESNLSMQLQSDNLEEALANALSPFKARQLELRGFSIREIDQFRAQVLDGRTSATILYEAITQALIKPEGIDDLRALINM